MSSRTACFLALSSMLFACGDDDGTTDAGTDAGMRDASTPDTSMPDTSTPDTSTPDTAVPDAGDECTIENFAVEFELAEYFEAEQYFLYSGDSGDVDPIDTFYFELYGADGATIGPHTFTFTGENYDTCTTCVTIEANCTAGVCTQVFLARSGTVAITALEGAMDAAFTATFTNMVFDEVTIDPDTGTSTVIDDGEIWCNVDIDVDTTVELSTTE